MTKLGTILLAIFLILFGMNGLGVPMGLVLSVLALLAGIVILLQVLGALPTHPRQ